MAAPTRIVSVRASYVVRVLLHATLGEFTWVSSVPAKCEFPASVMAGEAATYTFGLQCPACSMAGCLYDSLYLEPLLGEWVIVGLQSRWVGG